MAASAGSPMVNTTNPAYEMTTANEQTRQKIFKLLAELLFQQAGLLRTCCGRSWGFHPAEVRTVYSALSETMQQIGQEVAQL